MTATHSQPMFLPKPVSATATGVVTQASPAALPARVARLVAEETRTADRLAALVVLGIAGFLGLLYLLSPKALDGAMTEVRPVPMVVILFVLASLFRLWLVRNESMSRVAVFAFIVVDFALFYGLIFSFHLQYEQPAAFYLKAPTFLFVFLLIAVRALRLEPWSVAAAGLVAALGWAMMAAYAAMQAHGFGITRDFVTYMTSNAILVGAEIEKIVAILLVTLVLMLAIRRARRQLVAAARGRTAQEDLSRFFPPEIASRIASGEERLEPGQGDVRCAGILVVDLRGFTDFAASHPPEAVMRFLVAYQHRIGAIVATHGGAIDKFLGDGILATFGCTRPTPSPASDALRAACAIADDAAIFLASQNPVAPRGIGAAVSAGDLLFGTVGDEDRLEFTVIGEPVNLASKLEANNRALGAMISVDGATWTRALREGFVDPGGFGLATAVHVPGCPAPLDVHYRRVSS